MRGQSHMKTSAGTLGNGNSNGSAGLGSLGSGLQELFSSLSLALPSARGADAQRESRLRSVLQMSKPLWWRAVVLTLWINLLGLMPAVFSLQIYDRVIYRAGMNTLAALVIGMIIVLCFDLLLRRSRARLLRETAVHIDARISGALMNHFLALPLRTVESKPAAHWYSLFKDVEIVRSASSGGIAITVMDVPFAILALCLIAF